MPFKLDEAFVELNARDINVDKKLKDVDKGLKNVSKSAGIARKAIVAIGTAISVRFASGFLKQSTALLIEQTKAETQLAAVIRATGGAAGFTAGKLKRQAAELQNLTGIGDEVTISAQAILGIFKNVQGEAFERTIELGQDLTVLFGTDMRQAVRQLGLALDQPSTGLTLLRRAGIAFSQEQLKQIKDLEKQNRLFEAQKIILDEVESKVGGLAKAYGETLGGEIQKAQSAWGDFREEVAKTFEPAIKESAKRLAELNKAITPSSEITPETLRNQAADLEGRNSFLGLTTRANLEEAKALRRDADRLEKNLAALKVFEDKKKAAEEVAEKNRKDGIAKLQAVASKLRGPAARGLGATLGFLDDLETKAQGERNRAALFAEMERKQFLAQDALRREAAEPGGEAGGFARTTGSFSGFSQFARALQTSIQDGETKRMEKENNNALKKIEENTRNSQLVSPTFQAEGLA